MLLKAYFTYCSIHLWDQLSGTTIDFHYSTHVATFRNISAKTYIIAGICQFLVVGYRSAGKWQCQTAAINCWQKFNQRKKMAESYGQYKKKGLKPLTEKIKVIKCGSMPAFSLHSFIYGGRPQDQHCLPLILLHVVKYIQQPILLFYTNILTIQPFAID